MTPAGVMRPMRPGFAFSVNQRLPSGPAVMSVGWELLVSPAAAPKTVATPAGVMRPIPPGSLSSVYQRLPSGPAAMLVGSLSVTPVGNSVMTPAGVMRPMRPGFDFSVNQRAPSGPAVMSVGSEFVVSPVVKVVTVPDAGDTRAMYPGSFWSVNQRLPSGPAVMPVGSDPLGMPAVNSFTDPAGVSRAMPLPLPNWVSQTFPSGPAVMPVGSRLAVKPPNSVMVGAAEAAAGAMRAPTTASTIGSLRTDMASARAGRVLTTRRPQLMRRSRPAHSRSRSSNLRTFPVEVRGSSSISSTASGHL